VAESLKRITLDTNILPVDDILLAAPEGAFEFAVISVTVQEAAGTGIAVSLKPLGTVPEKIAWGQGAYGAHVYGGMPDKECCERALAIISNGAFPRPERRANLSHGQLRQQKDALILCAHVRDRRDVLVTNDRHGFINDGRREALQSTFGTTIMTREEFLDAFGLRR
jgi:hypothetical protein